MMVGSSVRELGREEKETFPNTRQRKPTGLVKKHGITFSLCFLGKGYIDCCLGSTVLCAWGGGHLRGMLGDHAASWIEPGLLQAKHEQLNNLSKVIV